MNAKGCCEHPQGKYSRHFPNALCIEWKGDNVWCAHFWISRSTYAVHLKFPSDVHIDKKMKINDFDYCT